MKHICFFNTVSFWGGGEKLHLEYALQFKARGYDVCIACTPDSPLDQAAKQHDIPVFHFRIKNLSFLSPLKKRDVRRFFEKEQIDTVFFSTSQDVKVGGLAAKSAQVKRVIYLRGLAVPIKGSSINKKVFEQCITHIVANSEETKRTTVGQFSTTVKKKAHVIYHGIDLHLFDSASERQAVPYQRKGNEILIGTAGRLTEQKGQKYLLEAVSVLVAKGHNVRILLAGTGPLEDDLKQQAETLKLGESIQFLGFVKEMEGFLKGLDFFVLPSLWEGFGYAIVEAMAAQKAVVAFRLSSNPEIIADGETGILVDEVSGKGLAEGMEQVLQKPERWSQYGEAGRKRVEEKFQLATVIDELEQHLLLSDKE